MEAGPKAVTVEAVRLRARVSQNTAHAVVQDWRTAQVSPAATQQLPEATAEECAAFERIRLLARAQVAKELEGSLTAAADVASGALADVDRLTTENTRLTTALEDAQAKLEQQAAQLSDARADLDRLEAAEKELVKLQRALNRATREKSAAKEEIAELKGQLATYEKWRQHAEKTENPR